MDHPTKLPSYTSPQKGLLSTLPLSWVPYAELMRIDRPGALYAYYIPYVTGTFFAASIADPLPSPEQIFHTNFIFLLGSFVLRSAACAWNDNLDQEFDRNVARCRLRPIARGAITTGQGHLFALGLALTGVPILACLPSRCTYHATIIAVLFALYPFGKRVTYYPSVFLGFPFSWAIFLACDAFAVDPFDRNSFAATISLFVSNILWVTIYDFIYAHQDIKDDAAAGVKSMAVHFAESAKQLASCLAAAQVVFLVATGWLADMGSTYYLIACGGTSIALAGMIANVDLRTPASCARWFHRGFWLVGGSMIIGMFAEYFERFSRNFTEKDSLAL